MIFVKTEPKFSKPFLYVMIEQGINACSLVKQTFLDNSGDSVKRVVGTIRKSKRSIKVENLRFYLNSLSILLIGLDICMILYIFPYTLLTSSGFDQKDNARVGLVEYFSFS